MSKCVIPKILHISTFLNILNNVKQNIEKHENIKQNQYFRNFNKIQKFIFFDTLRQLLQKNNSILQIVKLLFKQY